MIAVPPRLNIPSNIPSNIQAISKQYPTASDYRISSSTWLPLYVLSHASPPSQSGTDAAAAGPPPPTLTVRKTETLALGSLPRAWLA